ncbi:DoxX family membrane protein [Actinomadura oligospora]|uniref:DoxX family membrane protein n=1 Tax=Actinomadura oligospora TaxID=111804 RepID=UPI0004B9EAC4|nr:DoxX family membrane protein [Actinomadura oligospora]
MSILARPHQMPMRIMTGAFILNSGLGKIRNTEEMADGIHGTAVTAYPFLKDWEPQKFTRMLGTAEVAIGATLLTPFVPSLLAGAALTGFSAGLLGLYLKLPGMREEGGLRPTQQGIPFAKDSWLLGIGLSLVMDACSGKKRRGHH